MKKASAYNLKAIEDLWTEDDHHQNKIYNIWQCDRLWQDYCDLNKP